MKKSILISRVLLLPGICFLMVLSGCYKADLPHHLPTQKQLLVGGFVELQGSTVGPDRALYVTAPLDGTIWRVNPKNGAFTVFTNALPKRNPDPFFQGAGVVDVAFRGWTAFALVTGVADDLGGTDIVGIYRVDGPHSYTIIADIGAWSVAHPPVPDFFVPTGFQYSFESYRDGFVVTDGHHNRVLYVTLNGEITELIAFPNVVPTGLAQRGNRIYLTQAGPIPHHPENAKLLYLSPNSSTATEVATAAGLDVGLFVDVEFGFGNNIFTLAQGKWNGPYEGAPADPNTGALLVLKPNGSFGVLVDKLNQPTSMEFIGDNAYVVSLAGEIWKISDDEHPAHGH
jgi:sugar lactone lactonase YvrE